MRPGVAIGVRWAILALASTLSIFGQSAGTGGQVYREIDDPNTGDRWLLLRDPSHPGGPGRLVQTQKPLAAQRSAQVSGAVAPHVSGAVAPLEADAVVQLPVIHAGDELIVERDTKTVEERLEAVALGPATKGSTFDVRLKIGGKVLPAVALGPSRPRSIRFRARSIYFRV